MRERKKVRIGRVGETARPWGERIRRGRRGRERKAAWTNLNKYDEVIRRAGQADKGLCNVILFSSGFKNMR